MQFYALTNIGIISASFGLVCLCLLRGKIRLIGMVMWVSGVATTTLHQPAALYISDNVDQVMLRREDATYTMLRGTSRAFSTKDWMQTEALETVASKQSNANICDKDMCQFTLTGKRIAVIASDKNDDVLDAACKQRFDIIIAPRYIKKTRCKAPKIRIGKRELNRFGAHSLHVVHKELQIHTARNYPRTRLWLPAAPKERGSFY